MNANLTVSRRLGAAVVVVAFFSTVIGISILAGVADLFESGGAPMAPLAAAERACAAQEYLSDRELCMHEWLTTAASGDEVAHK